MNTADDLSPSMLRGAFHLLFGRNQYAVLANNQDLATNLEAGDLRAAYVSGKWPAAGEIDSWTKRNLAARSKLRRHIAVAGAASACVLGAGWGLANMVGMPLMTPSKHWGVAAAWPALWAGLLQMTDGQPSYKGKRLDERLRRAAVVSLVCGAALSGFVAALLSA